MAKRKKVRGFVDVDFARYFPGKTWVSNWAKDKSYPGGYCYKLMSTRDITKHTVEMVLVLQRKDGLKEEMLRCTAPKSEADAAAAYIMAHLTKSHGLDFQEQDFSRIRTLTGYLRATRKFGWIWKPPPLK
jgi:hypothetical protein